MTTRSKTPSENIFLKLCQNQDKGLSSKLLPYLKICEWPKPTQGKTGAQKNPYQPSLGQHSNKVVHIIQHLKWILSLLLISVLSLLARVTHNIIQHLVTPELEVFLPLTQVDLTVQHKQVAVK